MNKLKLTIRFFLVCIAGVVVLSTFVRCPKKATVDDPRESLKQMLSVNLPAGMTNIVGYKETGIDFGNLFYLKASISELSGFIDSAGYEEITHDHPAYQSATNVTLYLLNKSKWNIENPESLMEKVFYTETKFKSHRMIHLTTNIEGNCGLIAIK